MFNELKRPHMEEEIFFFYFIMEYFYNTLNLIFHIFFLIMLQIVIYVWVINRKRKRTTYSPRQRIHLKDLLPIYQEGHTFYIFYREGKFYCYITKFCVFSFSMIYERREGSSSFYTIPILEE